MGPKMPVIILTHERTFIIYVNKMGERFTIVDKGSAVQDKLASTILHVIYNFINYKIVANLKCLS